MRSTAAHARIVDVDVDDAGTAANPLLVEGQVQVQGGLAQGVAPARYGEVRYHADGNPLTTTFAGSPR